jgi:ubiquinone/menaquinone biosynthesis C-methylase UbiE/uncharacterized protein YbaR (Trm112 family)
LEKYSTPPDSTERNHKVAVERVLLACGECGRWYPVFEFIPELLPDHLRNWENDIIFLESFSNDLPSPLYMELVKGAEHFQEAADKIHDTGKHYKVAESSIIEKVTDSHFFGPGYFSPFNRYNPKLTEVFIRNFGLTVPLLKLNQNNVVLDVCTAYSWTTEWMFKMGYESIGIDICRTYMEIGIKRMGDYRPHLIIGDVENLPVKTGSIHSVLGFDGFHHIFDRKKTMAHFFRALDSNGRVVLAEPGGDHEYQKPAKKVMEKYNILEKGMDIEDVESYCEDLNSVSTDQYFMLSLHHKELDQGLTLTPQFVESHSLMNWKIYVLEKKHKSLHSTYKRTKTRVKNKLKKIVREKRIFN